MLDKLVNDFIEIELSGKTYKAGKITVGDLGLLRKFALKMRRQEMAESAKDVYGDNIPDIIKADMFKTPKESELQPFIESIECNFYMIWLSLVKFNPSLTFDEVKELVTVSDLQKFVGITPDEDDSKNAVTPETL